MHHIKGNFFWRDISYIYKGRLELPANFIAFLGQYYADYADYIIPYLSLAFLAIPFWLMAQFRAQIRIGFWQLAVLIIIIFGLIQSRRVFMPSANEVHFYFCLTVLVILLLPAEAGSAIMRWVLMLISGLSGATANFFALAFVVKACKTRKRQDIIEEGYTLRHGGFSGSQHFLSSADCNA